LKQIQISEERLRNTDDVSIKASILSSMSMYSENLANNYLLLNDAKNARIGTKMLRIYITGKEIRDRLRKNNATQIYSLVALKDCI